MKVPHLDLLSHSTDWPRGQDQIRSLRSIIYMQKSGKTSFKHTWKYRNQRDNRTVICAARWTVTSEQARHCSCSLKRNWGRWEVSDKALLQGFHNRASGTSKLCGSAHTGAHQPGRGRAGLALRGLPSALPWAVLSSHCRLPLFHGWFGIKSLDKAEFKRSLFFNILYKIWRDSVLG